MGLQVLICQRLRWECFGKRHSRCCCIGRVEASAQQLCCDGSVVIAHHLHQRPHMCHYCCSCTVKATAMRASDGSCILLLDTGQPCGETLRKDHNVHHFADTAHDAVFARPSKSQHALLAFSTMPDTAIAVLQCRPQRFAYGHRGTRLLQHARCESGTLATGERPISRVHMACMDENDATTRRKRAQMPRT